MRLEKSLKDLYTEFENTILSGSIDEKKMVYDNWMKVNIALPENKEKTLAFLHTECEKHCAEILSGSNAAKSVAFENWMKVNDFILKETDIVLIEELEKDPSRRTHVEYHIPAGLFRKITPPSSATVAALPENKIFSTSAPVFGRS